jgi:choline kinase
MINKAIILAAGAGKRMAGALGGGPPKPLLPLNEAGDLTFVDWHLQSLRAQGAREIYLVGSRSTFGATTTAMRSIPVTWILNDFPCDRSGSGHSAHLAFESDHAILDGRSRVVLMDADLVYDPTLLADLAAAPRARSKTLVCGRYRDTGEEVLVFGDADGAPRLQGKGLLGGPLVQNRSCLGEATGILLLEPQDHDLWRRAAAWCMRFSTAGTRAEHEDITGWLLALGAMDAVIFEDDARFMECDTPDEYQVARREMVPRWIASLREQTVAAGDVHSRRHGNHRGDSRLELGGAG